MKTRIATIAAIASLAFAPAAFASDKFEIEFSFSPVEVATADGAEKIYDDLEAAIKEECQPTNMRARIQRTLTTEACINATLDEAVAELDAPEVTKVHEIRRG